MKIKLDIDCTPNEIREFFGLPEVKPLQEELLKELQERLRANIKAMPRGDAEDLAAGDPQGLRAAAGDVSFTDEWGRRQTQIAVARALDHPGAGGPISILDWSGLHVEIRA